MGTAFGLASYGVCSQVKMKRNLESLVSHQFDLLIVGAGIHGALAAWDATLRGLSVALIERGDFGSATSQNSLKIVHGGLRYLQDVNLSRIRTMARERTTWMRIAPHLIHPLDCLMPTQKKISRSRLIMGAALAVNDLLSFDRNRSMDPQKFLKPGSIISKHELSNLLPGYNMDGLTGAALWHDAQIYNSERLLLEFILSAAHEGAQVANYVEATAFLQTANRISGVKARDMFTGQEFEIQAKLVINCAGAWADQLLGTSSVKSRYATSIAMNLVVDQVWSGIAAGLPSRPVDGRPSQVLFFVPWRDKTMIGTGHIPWNNSPDEFKVNEAVIRGFIKEINSAHPSLKLSMEKVHHVTWGFLPVDQKDAQRKTVKLTRDGVVINHQAKDGLSGLISVLGVKYTTARSVAEQAVDLAVRKLNAKTKKCQTRTTPVHSGWIDEFKPFLANALAKTPRGMDEEIVEHLACTYGLDYRHFLNEMNENHALSERVDPHLPVTVSEVLFAIRDEMALTLLDIIQRRTELGSTGLPSMKVLQKCVELMGCEMGWSLDRQQQEIDCVLQAYPIKRTEGITA
jgi:glycerol-3-phosphate dehydrogenase